MSKDKSNKSWFGRHKILSVLGAIVIIIIIAAIASGGKNKTGSSNAADNSGSSAAKNTAKTSGSGSSAAATPKLNQPADDGKFQFTVTGFTCGQTQVANPDDTDLVVNAKGQYCLMQLTVKNIGSQSQNFDASSQYVYDASNTQYSSDTEATDTIEGSSQFADFPSLNPGVSITGTIVFDVPTTVTPTTATLHDSSLSNGVKVNLQ